MRLDDLLAMIRDPTAATAYIRRQRDWFFRTNTAWTTVLNDWNSAPSHYDEFLWKVVERTYMFLAPRFMPFTEWVSAQAKMKSAPVAAKVW